MKSVSLCGPRKARTVGQRDAQCGRCSTSLEPSSPRSAAESGSGPATTPRAPISLIDKLVGAYTTTSHRWHEACPTWHQRNAPRAPDGRRGNKWTTGTRCSRRLSEAENRQATAHPMRLRSGGIAHSPGFGLPAASAKVTSCNQAQGSSRCTQSTGPQPTRSKVWIGGAEATVGGIRLQIQQ